VEIEVVATSELEFSVPQVMSLALRVPVDKLTNTPLRHSNVPVEMEVFATMVPAVIKLLFKLLLLKLVRIALVLLKSVLKMEPDETEVLINVLHVILLAEKLPVLRLTQTPLRHDNTPVEIEVFATILPAVKLVLFKLLTEALVKTLFTEVCEVEYNEPVEIKVFARSVPVVTLEKCELLLDKLVNTPLLEL
jgi:hypothetical protein